MSLVWLYSPQKQCRTDHGMSQSELTGRICDFPYEQCLRDSAAIKDFDIPSDGQQSTSALVKAVDIRVGIAMNENDAEARRNVVQLLQGGGRASSAFATAVKPQSQARAQYAVQPVSAPQPIPVAEKQLAMYTMRLNEWAGAHNYTVRYTYEQLSVDPPLWECTARVPDGQVLKDSGKNKTTAKHMALMKVCKVRGLRV